MPRKATQSLLLLAAYFIAAGLLAWTPWLILLQSLIILLPPLALLVGLTWTTARPEYTATAETRTEPIEDLDPPARKILWLNGWWEFRLPNDQRWRRCHVPHSWNTIRGLEYYEGQGYYRRLFKIEDGWSLGRVALHFRGCNYRTVVSIDGREVGRHEGGYTPFSIDITDRVTTDRRCELEVMVDNRLSRETVPNVVGWRNEGGILRETWIETTRPIHISDVTAVCEPDLKGRASAILTVRIENPEWLPRDYHIEVFSPQGALVHEHKEENWSMQQIEHAFDINFVALWSPQNPALYTCRVTMLGEDEDQFVLRFGVRGIAIKDNRLLLNGEPLALRGVSRITDHHDTGMVETLAAIKDDLQHVRDAGYNCVRLGPTPAHPRVLDQCDRLGLLVLEELPAWYGMSFDLADPMYQQSAAAQLRELIIRDRNHPCVLMWGLAHNIENETQEGRWFLEHLVKTARGLDNRPVYFTAGGAADKDMCADLVDAVMLVQWGADMRHIPDMQEEIEQWGRRAANKPLFPMFPGVAALRGATLRWGGHWSEDRQAFIMQQYIKQISAHERTAGFVAGTLCDYRDPGNVTGPVPFMRLSGLLNHWREPKTSFDVIRRLLKDNEEVKLSTAQRRVPITSFSKAVGIIAALVGLAFWFKLGAAGSSLFYNPNLFLERHPGAAAFGVALFATTLTSVAWAININRFIKSAPRKIMSAVNMPYYLLLSHLLRSEAMLFTWSFLTLGVIFTFATTVLHLAIDPAQPFLAVAVLTAACTMPDAVFSLSAFFRLPLWFSISAYHVWKAVVCYLVLGPLGMIIYVFIAPYILVGAFFAFVQWKFHVLKYARKMLKR
jgi:hypothetical protein